ncbi:uncharacterized protein [Typha latifolia]|uniref:uncharacterized protein n=1 Tax=Typha latifolia TaxID=4733 RepID=UPI003C2DBA5E
MPTVAAFLPRALFLSRPRLLLPSLATSRLRQFSSASPLPLSGSSSKGNSRHVCVVSSSAASFDELDAKGKSRRSSSKKSILLDLIQDIEPFDVSITQKDVPAETIDAMKRTISGMLGLLPSDQFHVLVEAFWEPIFKILVSSMMTGYTLRNAEYRLSFERNLEFFEEDTEHQTTENMEDNSRQPLIDITPTMFSSSGKGDPEKNNDELTEKMSVEGLGDMTPEAKEYILRLQSRLNSMKKELHDIKRKNSALQMQQFVGEEKNDLLDYLRSLQPEKVAELSEPTCPGVHEAIHSVVHGLLATLSPKMHSKAPLPSENATGGAINIGNDDCTELVENTSLHFQPLISVSRDYLARLLFWCMLLGHYLRGLEYRLELMKLLTISSDAGSISHDSDYVA